MNQIEIIQATSVYYCKLQGRQRGHRYTMKFCVADDESPLRKWRYCQIGLITTTFLILTFFMSCFRLSGAECCVLKAGIAHKGYN